MKVIVTGGGTGGHIYPALSIVDGLKKEYSDLEIIYVGTSDRMESTMIPELGLEFVGLKMQGVNRKNILKNFKLIYLLIKNFFIIRSIIKKRQIDIVIGTGGYVTVPVVYTASKLNVPTLIFDADVNFGMATRKLLKHVDVVCSGFEKPSLDYDKVTYTGNPRGQLIYSKVKRDNIANKVLFVFGSLGSETINNFFIEYFNNNELDYDVKYVTGNGLYNDFVSKLNNSRVSVVEYVEDIDMELTDVSFVVARSGATFVSELEALAIPAIYIPSPYVANNEQVQNVQKLLDDNMTYMIEEFSLNDYEFNKAVLYMIENNNRITKDLVKQRKIDSLDLIVGKVKELVDE